MHESLPNTIDYIEMPSRNLVETKRFFSALFKWTFQDYGPDYAAFDDGRTTGGFFTSDKTARVESGSPLIVFYHPDLAKMVTDVKKLGEKRRVIFPLCRHVLVGGCYLVAWLRSQRRSSPLSFVITRYSLTNRCSQRARLSISILVSNWRSRRLARICSPEGCCLS